MQFPEEQTLKIKLFPDLISFSSEESNENTHLPIEIQKETFPIDQLEEIYKKIVSHKIKEAFIQYNQVLSFWKSKMHEKTISEIFAGSFSTINYIALDYLYQKDIETSKYILWKCEEIIQNDSLNHFFDSKILLYNNLGCCYKALDELFESLTYFEKALNIIEKGTGKKYIGYTYLNISIILFKQKRYDDALIFGKKAISESENELSQLVLCLPQEEREKNKEYQLMWNVTLHSYEHMAMQEEINKKFKSAFIYLEKTYKFVQHYYGNSSKLKLFEMNIRNFKERYKVLFKSPAKDAKDALMKGKKRKKMTKKSGINLELEKLKPYFEAYNITPNDLFFSRKKWAFKSNSKKGNETNLKSNITRPNTARPANPANSPSLFNNYFQNSEPTKFLFPSFNSTRTNGPKNFFFPKPSLQSNSLSNFNNLIKIEDYSNIHYKNSKDNESIIIDRNELEENEEIPNINKEECRKNRKEFLFTLKQYEATINNNNTTIENMLEDSKSKGNESINIFIPKKKNNILNKNENSNQLLNPKKKAIDLKIACSSSPLSNSILKSNLTPKRIKISVNTKKLTRPSFSRTPKNYSKETNDKYIKIIQRNMHKWFQNHTIKARFYKIIFHSPSFEIKNLEKSPIKKSKIGLDNSSLEKNIKGSLLIIYYQKINEVRTVFKITTAKKLHYHLFDFNAFEKMEETLKVKIMREFFKEILKSFCIYYDDLLMIREFLTVKINSKINFKLTRFVFKELLLEKKEENETIVSIAKYPNILEKDFLSNEIETSLDVDPLFSNLQNSSFERIEPLLASIPLSDLTLNQNPSPIMRMHQNPFDYLDEEGVIESPGIEPILINLKRVDEKKENEVIEMNLISQNRFNNIRVFTSFSRLEDQHENIENIGNNSERNKCLKEENIEKKKETMSALRRIQCFIRKTLFKVKKNICESQNFEVKVSIIRKIGDLYIWLKLIYHKIKNNYFLHAIFYELSERKLNGSRRKKKIEVFKIDIPKELSLKILDSPKPFVWFQINSKLKMISIRNMQIYERTLSKFEKIFLSKKKLWSLFFFNSLSFCQKCGKLIAKMHMNLSKQLEFQNKAIENETFKKILSFSQQMRLNLSFFSIVLKFFYERKSVFSRILFARLKLKTFLLKQITIFAEKIDYFIALSRQRALYKQTLKVLIENSRFKDYIPIKKRVLFLNKRMINAFIYYNPIKLEILITSEDSDIKEYNEILTHDKKIKEMTIIYINDVSNYRETLKKMLDLLTMNITLIKCDSKSLEKTFKLYSPESLSSALFLQRYILKKLYFRIFEISDKEYDYKCKVCVHLSTYNGISRIVLLLKTLPSFVKNICDFPDNCLNYLQIADKMNNLENFIERYVSFNERQKEFVFIPPSNNKWIIKKKKETLIQNQEKSFFELGAEIDYLNDKISIRLLKDENKFYKILIPESFTLSQKKKFIKEALESCIIYKDDDKLRLISDDDKYGPLIQKTKFSRVEERMLEGNIRIIDSKRFIILLIEFSQTKNHSTVSAIRLPYNSDDQKLKIIDKLKTEAVTGLTYNVSQGICHLDDNLYNECLAICNDLLEASKCLMNSPSLVNEDLKSHIDLKGTPEMKYSEKSFQNKPKSRKVPGRALISNENRSKSNKTLTKKLKDGNFEKEFYPTENSPKLQFKKDVGFSFASHLEAKVIEKDQQDNRKINDLNNERDFSDISPKSKSSISSASLVKSDMIPSEIKEFNINLTFVKQKYKKGFSLKQDTNSFENNSNNTILDQSKKGLNSRQDYYSSDNNNNINNSNSNNNSNNNVMTDENSKDVIKTKNNNYNPTKFKAQSSLENIISETNIAVKTTKETNEAASLIQRFYRKRMALKNNSETNAMINPEIIEIAKNYLHFANPRRPCDYHIVISKDPHDVIKAILIIQTWTRKILSFKKHLLKKSNESLNEAHISVNCEESNLDSIRSVSFLDNVNDDEKNDQDMEEVVQENNERYNNVCYEKDEDEG